MTWPQLLTITVYVKKDMRIERFDFVRCYAPDAYTINGND